MCSRRWAIFPPSQYHASPAAWAFSETSPDLEYTLETVACIGVCALAPNIVINQETHGNLNPKKVARLFEGKRKK
jgi:NADH:ubiquinone oxidoreductase subunit E